MSKGIFIYLFISEEKLSAFHHWVWCWLWPCHRAWLSLILCNPVDRSPPDFSVRGISQQEYWNGLPFPTPVDLAHPRISCLLYWQADSFPLAPPGKPGLVIDGLSYVEGYFLFTHFVESFFIDRCWILSNAFSAHMILIPHFVNVAHLTNWFANTKPWLRPWNDPLSNGYDPSFDFLWEFHGFSS